MSIVTAIIFAAIITNALKLKQALSLLFVLVIASRGFSQDTLPRFTLDDRGERVIISWTNPYQSLIQLNVQRSYDSLRNYTTIYSAVTPQLPQNGFSDRKLPATRVFYRIFYVLQGGSYFFSPAKRVGAAGGAGAPLPTASNRPQLRDLTSPVIATTIPGVQKTVRIRVRDVEVRQMPAAAFPAFRDSVLHQTKDTLFAINDSLVAIRPYVAKEVWRPSPYVFVNKDGYIHIALPLYVEKKYAIKFFEENGSSLFEIEHVKESPLVLDKASFVHSGWFVFELYEDNKLKEKNKFYLPKDF